jgi:2-polyprenyl-3-methyl-5-hydroxy-6-metoxy-1,4-benzoquinol methylase
MSLFKSVKFKIRKFIRYIVANQTHSHLQNIRLFEFKHFIKLFPKKGRLLEVGAGVGWQSKELSLYEFNVSAIDLPNSEFSQKRVWPIVDYDGKKIPFDDHSFDIVFSSNVLEHIADINGFQAEIKRVLKPDGYCLHLIPSGSWRFWTNYTSLIKYMEWPRRHGEHARDSFHEIELFGRKFWSNKFNEAGWQIVSVQSNKLFYTGVSLCDRYLPIYLRFVLHFILGGSCNIYILANKDNLKVN